MLPYTLVYLYLELTIPLKYEDMNKGELFVM